MITRRQIRIKVLQAYYAQVTSGNNTEDVFRQLLLTDYNSLKASKTVANAAPDAMEYTPAEDAVFLSELFMGAIKNSTDYEKLIGTSLTNWDINRVATIDRIVLLLAIHEMIAFKDIPVKVTINEYLDIAKQYSTEKSSQFVNGILDAVFHKLKEENKIVKTGRGLLDPTPNNSLETTKP